MSPETDIEHEAINEVTFQNKKTHLIIAIEKIVLGIQIIDWNRTSGQTNKQTKKI